MGLRTYNAKRDFSKTSEPRGSGGRKSKKAANSASSAAGMRGKTTTKKKAAKAGVTSGRAGARRGAAVTKPLSFVIQQHDATRLHYDVRLEIDGVLKSWAVPKGPSLDPAEKCLAVEVEDHPLEYAMFEGTIPEGNYGAGNVIVWDRGTWTLVDGQDAAAAHRAGKIKFELHGDKLRGVWTLVRMKDGRGSARGDAGKTNWLLIKHPDEHARPIAEGDVRTERPESVVSGAALQPRKRGKAATGRVIGLASKKTGATAARRGTTPKARAAAPKRLETAAKRRRTAAKIVGVTSEAVASHAAAMSRSRRAKLPDFTPPQLALLRDMIPAGDAWLHEVKFDGYRLAARLDGSRVQLLTRHGHDWTHKFPELASDLRALDLRAMLDGELVAMDEQGRSSFARLQRALKDESPSELAFLVFDVTFAGRHDVTEAPLTERRELLEMMLGDGAGARERVRISRAIEVDGEDLIEHACRLGLEGIVSKAREAPYRSDRSGAWVKVKCGQRQEFVVVGFSGPRGSRAGIGALLLGVYEGNELVYAGKVGTGFDADLLMELRRRLEKLAVNTSPATRLPRDGTTRGATWVAPKLVCEVTFAEWTSENRLRHAVFQGLREDKDSREVVRETTAAKPSARRPGQAGRAGTAGNAPGSTSITSDADEQRKAAARSPARRGPKQLGAKRATIGDDATVEGVAISHPDRIIDASSGVTKLGLARCYAVLARWMLPELDGRPVSLVRCPAGVAGQHFFQRHLKKAPPGVRLVNVDVDEPDELSPVIETPAGLIALVQLNAVEFHPWGSRVDDIERPDRLIFDLDPGEGVTWDVLAGAATIVRNELAGMELETYVKTTGGKGIHVVLPVRPRATWEEAKSFAHGVSQRLASDYGELFVTKMGAKNRVGKVFADYLRNQRSATAAGAYCVRARPGMGVSMPIEWEEISSVRPDQFTVATAAAHLHGRKRDPWAGIAKVRQVITSAMARRTN